MGGKNIMSRVFFGKMREDKQVEEKIYETGTRSFLGDIKEGDYAFIKSEGETKPASIKRLWKLHSIKEIEGRYFAYFDEVFIFNQISLQKFQALDLFILNVNLLNKCFKSTKGLSFFEISLTDEKYFESLTKEQKSFEEYILNNNHYRKIVKLKNKSEAQDNSINVQFYKENDSWQIYDAPFIGDDLKNKYDSTQLDKYLELKVSKKTQKKQLSDFLTGDSEETDKVPIMGIWDLFCGNANENNSKIREDFKEFCEENDIKKASRQYERGIRAIEEKFKINVDEEYKIDKCENLKKRIDELDKYGNQNNWSTYLNKYLDYKEKDEQPQSNQLDNDKKYDYKKAKHNGINKIIYGVPGCGKSYYVDNEILNDEQVYQDLVVRTTFFQDYTNTDFVGQILPSVDKDGSVNYRFNPGPFTKALKLAIDNPDEKVVLIVEELNRGNAPSIFGDIFQLLDRDKGTSRYKIVNANIIQYLNEECLYDLDYIKIPANLYIFATMNTSDQNVFTLDTAFKRRWEFEKLDNDFHDKDIIGKKYVPGLKNITWKVFVKTINEFIVSHANSLSAEDKQIGKYFINKDLLIDNSEDIGDEEKIQAFAYKIFEYLWTDVAKFNRKDWFIEEVNSLDNLIYRYIQHENVFCSSLSEKLPIYMPEEEE